MQIESANVAKIKDWFGIKAPHEDAGPEGELPGIEPGKIVLITGASGAGKSRLLRRMRDRFRLVGRGRWIDLESVRLADRAIVDCFGRAKLERVLEVLGRMGLGEAWNYLRSPWELSEGERWRVRLARALVQRPEVIAADEFCAVLDRVTACVVARNLRKAIDAMPNIAVVVATSHDDLERALRPDLAVRCDF